MRIVGIALIVSALCALPVRAEIATNCFRLVTYLPKSCYHLEADVSSARFDFVLDFYGDTGWKVIDHGSNRVVCFAQTSRHHLVSYLDFLNESKTVEFGGETNLYCSFTWNTSSIKHSTADYVGWFHLRAKDGELELVSSGAEKQEGYRIEVEPDGWPLLVEDDDPPEDDTWLDPATGIRWRYTDYGTYCGVGTGCEQESALAAGDVPGELAVPGTIAGLPVGRIERDAFYGENVWRIMLPTSVTEVALCAFADSNVREIEIAAGNPVLKNVDGFIVSADGAELIVVPPCLHVDKIPETVAVIGTGAFAGCRCVNSDLVIPRSVKEIRAYAFLNAWISFLIFEGDAPVLDDDAFASGESCFRIRYRLGTSGWPCAFELQGHETEVQDDTWSEKSESDSERIAEDGGVWIDRVCAWRNVEMIHGKTSTQWTRFDREYWETNVTTRQVLPVGSDVMDRAYGSRTVETEYWDLEHVRERRERGWWTDYADTPKGYVEDEKVWKYDILGRLVSFENSEWYYDEAVDEQGLVEVEEKRTIDYPSEGVVRDETVRKSYYDDGTSMTEERYITCVNDLRDRKWSRDEDVVVVRRDGSVCKEEHFKGRKYAYEGWLELSEQWNRVTKDGFCRNDHMAVEYGKDGEIVSRTADASIEPTEYAGELVPLGPGSSCEVTAKDEVEALMQVKVSCTLPKGAGGVVDVRIQDYLSYFRRTAVRIGEDRWRVKFEIDPEAISLPSTVEDLAEQLSGIASGTVDGVTLRGEPGLWYGIGYSASPAGPYECDRYVLAESNTVMLPAPPVRSNLFMRILVRSTPPQ